MLPAEVELLDELIDVEEDEVEDLLLFDIVVETEEEAPDVPKVITSVFWKTWNRPIPVSQQPLL